MLQFFSLFNVDWFKRTNVYSGNYGKKNIDLLSMVDSFKDFQDATESGPSFGALFPAHLHKVHIWFWGTVRRDLGPAVWFDPFPYIEEYF